MACRESEDHPRVCGEKTTRSTTATASRGSPPRVRGEVSVLLPAPFAAWITPACAGRSQVPCYPSSTREDHPRVCGEKDRYDYKTAVRKGSPPRVRGEDVARPRKRDRHGITPACAGRSSIHLHSHSLLQDHPRVCGEKAHSRRWSDHVVGSPPRVRGEARRPRRASPALRITPACAGRRQTLRRTALGKSDHPRVCGEKTKKIPNISRFYPGAACFSFSFS